MKIEERYEIEIIDMGTEGEGIGRADGIAVFIPGAVMGDRVMAEIVQVKKNFARGKIAEILTHSPLRAKPVCSYAGQCGGCSLAYMSYEGQLQLKKKWVIDRLTRIGGIENPPVAEVMGMVETDSLPLALEEKEGEGPVLTGRQATISFEGGFPMRYRNKAQFPIRAGRLVKNREGKYRNDRPCSVGFYKTRSHEVIHCKKCLIQAEPAEAVAAAVKRYVEENTVSVYDEKTGMGLLRHAVVRSALATGEVMVVMVVNGDHLPKVEVLVELLDQAINDLPRHEGADQFWSLESVILNTNKAKGSEIMGKGCITIAGKSSIDDFLGGLKYEISPLSFYQVNPVQTKKLYDQVKEYAQLTGEETVLDLYCGIGTIGLYCASKARRVIGIESVKSAVMDANRSAVINGIVNAEFICGKAEEILPRRLSGIKADVVILDPPRSGCDPALLAAVRGIAPERIIYVSCDPATLARDIKILGGGKDQEMAELELEKAELEKAGLELAELEKAANLQREGCASTPVASDIDAKPDESTESMDCELQTVEETSGSEGAGEASEGSEGAAEYPCVNQGPLAVYQVEKVQPVDMFPGSGHVETVVLLSLKSGTPKIEVTMEVDSDSNYSPEEKATYQKIKEYVKDKYGVNVHTRYIAEVKRMCGIDMGENYNKSKKDEPDVKHCPQDKVGYIKEALKYFGVICCN